MVKIVQTKRIRVGKTYNTGNYTNEKLDIEEEYTGDDKKQYKLMKAKLDKLHYNEETKEERIRREINAKEKELEELRKQI